MSGVTLHDLRYARILTSGQNGELSEDDRLALAFDRLLVFNDGDVALSVDKQVQFPVIGIEFPEGDWVGRGRDRLPKLTSKLRRIRLGCFEYLRSVVHANSHSSSPVRSEPSAGNTCSSALTVQEGIDGVTPAVGVAGACQCAAPANSSHTNKKPGVRAPGQTKN